MLPKMPAALDTLLAAQQSNGHIIYFYQTLQHSWQYKKKYAIPAVWSSSSRASLEVHTEKISVRSCLFTRMCGKKIV